MGRRISIVATPVFWRAIFPVHEATCTTIVDRRDFVGIEATSVQHQIDHLNGKMYFDNLSKVKRDMLIKKARKFAR